MFTVPVHVYCTCSRLLYLFTFTVPVHVYSTCSQNVNHVHDYLDLSYRRQKTGDVSEEYVASVFSVETKQKIVLSWQEDLY
jgi:hypothetical protein